MVDSGGKRITRKDNSPAAKRGRARLRKLQRGTLKYMHYCPRCERVTVCYVKSELPSHTTWRCEEGCMSVSQNA